MLTIAMTSVTSFVDALSLSTSDSQQTFLWPYPQPLAQPHAATCSPCAHPHLPPPPPIDLRGALPGMAVKDTKLT
eukprot:766555-Hanusia_phi.AAC.1